MISSPQKGCCIDKRGRGRPSLDQAHSLTDDIVAQALVLFRRNGFAATTMDEVAAATGAAKHSIYRRFSSKEELFRAAVAFDRERLLQSVAALKTDENDPLTSLRRVARTLLHIVLAPGNIDLFRMCIAEAQRFPVISAEFAETGRQLHSILAPLVAAAQAQGMMISGDPTHIAIRLHHTIVGEALIAMLLGDSQCPSARDWEAYFDEAWEMAMTGIALPSSRCTESSER
ncbi:AcrR family transcriptional regulator [Rhodoligotrophos appendicifer]|uniref:TetR/AcrR family transcriptional regulator n=1 Tax=Rhodoligotrophos appendicifer TaxID=987056 RepID=UPI001185F625|nr:TetR/AcrR family transcriptional regulator [Rhodoligotrophos appendicifer]